MRRIFSIMSALLFCGVLFAQTSPIKVEWKMGKNGAEKGKYSSTFIITNVSDSELKANWDFYFNMFYRRCNPIDDKQVLDIEQFRPGYYKISPNKNYKGLKPGETAEITFLSKGKYEHRSYNPDAGHFMFSDNKDNIIPVSIYIHPLVSSEQWTIPGNAWVSYPDGKYMYKRNSELNPGNVELENGIYNVLPTPRDIKYAKGTTEFPKEVAVNSINDLAAKYLTSKLADLGVKVTENAKTKISLEVCEGISNNFEYYEMTVGDGQIKIVGDSQQGLLNGVKTLVSVLYRVDLPAELPNAVVVDFPDIHHRGMMLDIARNFTGYEDLKKYIDMLAAYKINVFHFHFNDDEGWRLEIPGLPELTEVGSRRGYTLDDKDFLYQVYSGNGNPDAKNSANGYITRDQFIDLLQYAQGVGVEVIPEIESPGHARAAIYSMKARERKYRTLDIAKAREYIMWDDADTSKYTSAQGYHDNALNFAMEGTYRFMEKIVDELIAMYKDAGVNLPAIHIGGDEVPNGAWLGSPVIQKFMKENGIKNVHEGGEYFLDRVSEMIYSKGVKVGGWQEVALKHSDEFNKKIAHRFAVVNAWSTVGRSMRVPYDIANSGYPVVLSNVNNFYFDLIYSRHHDEPGLNWGGVTDEFISWSAQPYNIYCSARMDFRDNPVDLTKAAEGKPALKDKSKIVGVQGQLWSETIRNFDMVSSYTFPRLLGMAERGWNAEPVWGYDYNDLTRYNAEKAKYNLKLTKYELPRIKRCGIGFHVAQPGIIIENGMLKANTQYAVDAVVRYTTDGSEPDENSAVWEAPVACDAKVVKAKAYYLGRHSVTTTYENK